MADKKGEFEKIINDFTKDLIGSYPELESTFDVIDYDDYYQHCKTVYPENFFHILYENIELFDDTSACYLSLIHI